jgi:hypothetical protein
MIAMTMNAICEVGSATELISEPLAQLVEDNTTAATQSFRGQELTRGVWVCWINEPSGVQLHSLHIDQLHPGLLKEKEKKLL